MVDINLIKDTINELLAANVDKDTIYMTLREIGVDQEDIDKYYEEAMTPKANTAREENTTVSTKSKMENRPIAKPSTTTEELESATNDVIESTPEVVEPINTQSPVKIVEVENYGPEIKQQITDLDAQIIDIKAQLNGLTKIMKDILDENRNILNKLK